MEFEHRGTMILHPLDLLRLPQKYKVKRSTPAREINAEVPAALRALLSKSHAPLHAGLDYSFHANVPTLCIHLSFQTVQLSLLLSWLREENGRTMPVIWE